MAKEGSTIGGLMDCFGTAVSMSLQYGVPLEVYVNKFSHTRFEPMGFTKNPDIKIAKSIVDYIFRWLGITFLPGYREANKTCRRRRRPIRRTPSRETRKQSAGPPPRWPAGRMRPKDRPRTEARPTEPRPTARRPRWAMGTPGRNMRRSATARPPAPPRRIALVSTGILPVSGAPSGATAGASGSARGCLGLGCHGRLVWQCVVGQAGDTAGQASSGTHGCDECHRRLVPAGGFGGRSFGDALPERPIRLLPDRRPGLRQLRRDHRPRRQLLPLPQLRKQHGVFVSRK